MTVQQLSDKLGIESELYKNIEEGRIRPSLSLFKKLIKELNLDEVECVILLKKEMVK